MSTGSAHSFAFMICATPRTWGKLISTKAKFQYCRIVMQQTIATRQLVDCANTSVIGIFGI